ncbi:2-octaprenyl-3-methyl-6-methoxy-12C4-benzoquinol hydroxylase [gamma proteobacterium IMCC2047]|nr:2-octaprenyl-3-methyl-6-methoxy-12C4-benzoquinol hydroxylase [gamma proteobacterium IMCC2047]
MSSANRNLSFLDQLLTQADRALRTIAGSSAEGTRPSPARGKAETELSSEEAKHVAGLMRINHTGEVCAQGLYQGQALTAKLEQVRHAMQYASNEEEDHLAWCRGRLNELDSHTSLLNPFFYGASFSIGALAGIAGDKWSLGFVAETEHQVCKHLESHLQKLPEQDEKSKAILEQMKVDEAQHAETATNAGGAKLPLPIRAGMSMMSKVMTKTTYHI